MNIEHYKVKGTHTAIRLLLESRILLPAVFELTATLRQVY